jgi:S1-C subfamily serine protease
MQMDSSATGDALQALSDELAGAVERAAHGVVAVNGRPRIASSGILWAPDVVVTANHTVKRDDDLSITLPDGRRVKATLAGRDSGTDIAVLRLAEGGLPAAARDDSTTLRIGQLVLAVGRTGEDGPSASFGVVSAVSGAWRTWRGGQIDRFIRLDLAIYYGFSGSALVNPRGEVVGLNSSGLSRGAAVALPLATVTRVTDELLRKGRVARGYLGIGMQPVRLPEQLRRALHLDAEGGLIVVGVEPGGPAERAGMFMGDVIVALDGAPLTEPEQLQATLGGERVGTPLTLSVIRGGTLAQVTLTVGERPRKGA